MRRVALVVALLAPLADVAPGGAQTTDTADIYAHAGANALAPAAARALTLVYVPNSHDGTVTVIDPATYRVVRTFPTGALPQHVVPSYDLTTLWVANNLGNSLTPIDPVTGREGSNVAVDDPYNLYFTPDGRFAIVIAERRRRLDFRDAHTMALVQSLPVACKGVDHMEFTADGRYAVATCEFSGQLVKVDLATRTVLGYLTLDPGGLDSAAMPQDIRARADGRVFVLAGERPVGGEQAARGRGAEASISWTRTPFGASGSSRPAKARTASTRAATGASCTSRTGGGTPPRAGDTGRARSRYSTRRPSASSRRGPCPAAAAPTWAT